MFETNLKIYPMCYACEDELLQFLGIKYLILLTGQLRNYD